MIDKNSPNTLLNIAPNDHTIVLDLEHRCIYLVETPYFTLNILSPTAD